MNVGDEHEDDDPAAVDRVAQQDRVREAHADPDEPEEGDGDPRDARGPRLGQSEQEDHGHAADEREQDRGAVSQRGGRDQAAEPDECSEDRRARTVVRREELVQADHAEDEEPAGEDASAERDERDRQHHHRQRRQEAGPEVGATVAPGRRARAAQALGRSSPTTARRGHQRPPKRRSRAPYSASVSSNASRV